jgi:hypothetical protein
MMQLTARAMDVVRGCIGGLDCAEKQIEKVKINPAEKLQERLTEALDLVREVQRQLKTLVEAPLSPPDWAEANAIELVATERPAQQETERLA